MIILDRELEPGYQEDIRNVYRRMIRDEGVDQLGYVQDKLLLKLAMLQASSMDMERRIGAYARVIHAILVQETGAGRREPHHKAMLSALYYLCDPFDYFPDLGHENAHLDDGFVINLCLADLREHSNPTYRRIMAIITSEDRLQRDRGA